MTIRQAAKRICSKVDADLQVVQSHLICWMEMRFEPKGLDLNQMNAFEAKLNQWIEDHKREQDK